MAVLLRSGKKLDERRVEKKDTKEENYAEIREEFKQHSSKTTEKEKMVKMSKSNKWKKEIQEKMKRLRLMNLKFHSLKGCKRQS